MRGEKRQKTKTRFVVTAVWTDCTGQNMVEDLTRSWQSMNH